MLLSTEATVKLGSKNVNYYKKLGYDIPMKISKKDGKSLVADYSKPLTVKIEDLSRGSRSLVDVLCDYCKKEIMRIPYSAYIKSIKTINKNACEKCKFKKIPECNLEKYGVPNTSILPEVKEKIKQTSLEKYNVCNYSQTEECKEKTKQTSLLKYGTMYPLQNEEVKEKIKNTCESRYGKNYKQKFIKKAIETFKNNTGYEHSLQCPEVREKITKTYYKNGTCPVSRQQFYIYSLYKNVNKDVELNYPISRYSADICIPNENLDIEVDLGGHTLSVKLGTITQEEFDHKEMVRNNIIKRAGYKIMRIVSSKDDIPSDFILLQMLSETRKYFSRYPNHSWIEWNLDSSIIRNAEQKDGMNYDFGKLRRIKKSDVENINVATEKTCA